jgi:ABC-type dipeptide/oligopeptide/nickel transport system ATPase subunit
LPVSANAFRGFNAISNEYWCSFFNNLNIDKKIKISATFDTKNLTHQLKLEPIVSAETSDASTTKSYVSHNGDTKPVLKAFGIKLIFTSPDFKEPQISSIAIKDDKLKPDGSKNSPIQGIFVSTTTRFDWKTRFASIQRKKQLFELISSLKDIEPQMTDIRLNDIGFLEADVGLPRLIPLNLMGGGTASFLSIAMAMLDSQDGVVLIDEIENGLHYSNQHKIWKAIFNWSQKFNVQVFATTHSFECMRAFNKILDENLFTDAKLIRIERQDEHFRAVEYDKNLLDESIESNLEIR